MGPALDLFSPVARGWFGSTFAAPTAVQEQGWQRIAAGAHTLLCAPTGSGKTLAAFLWSIDRLGAGEPPPPAERCRVLYISPLRALTVDVERNLRTPLRGMALEAERLGLPVPDIAVGVRSGDTPATERRALAPPPPPPLIPPPESPSLPLPHPPPHPPPPLPLALLH